jgi:hypothetical protein
LEDELENAYREGEVKLDSKINELKAAQEIHEKTQTLVKKYEEEIISLTKKN